MSTGTAVAELGTAMTHPRCAICGEPLTSERDPVCDDGACYHRLCMVQATAGDEAGASDEVTAR